MDRTFLMEQLKLLIPVALSLVLGFVIGFERKQRSKEAGIRTHTIVCMGSALMMVISKHAFAEFADFDPGRIAAQIITGIGFLGAGIIVYRKNSIHGLTTAAGVWATAGIGMATGAGLYVLAVGATVLMIAIQCFFHLQIKLFTVKNNYKLRVSFKDLGNDEPRRIKEIFSVDHFYQINFKRVGEELICDVTIKTGKLYSSETINKIMKENVCIISIDREED